ncbi:radical SAM protein, partial [Candidatus Woesearchaeota archaeon]|nr:radical SAM protein [Candidatus Woesearchaeota archaeon]
NKYLGLPLIGSSSFGIVDRNSNMLEIKPITGCNMNCIFCSVDEGLSSKKTTELVIEKDYLAEEARKVIEYKQCETHITINAQGEPTLYTPMPELIKALREIKQVKTISLITNATMLTKSYIDRLAAAGLTRLNISLNAASEKMAKILEGHGKYDVKNAKQMAEYAAGKMEVIIAPVFVSGYNDTELGEIIKFAKSIGAKAGIQNYLFYKRGRNPKNASQMPWEKFYEMLKKLEKEHEFKLMLDEKDFQITKTKPLPKPFRKGQITEAKIICPGRYPNETLAAAKDRNITITNFKGRYGEKAKIKITSDKHNIFYGKVA